MVYYISGGERSGKSRYAQNLALELSSNPIYLATARKWDDDFKNRVARHIADRNDQWKTIEEEKYLSKLSFKDETVVLDCITLWLTNWYIDTKNDIEKAYEQAKKELDSLLTQPATFIIISNEIGMGVHAHTAVGRKFVELQGWVNQYIAQKADKALFMVSGLPLTLK